MTTVRQLIKNPWTKRLAQLVLVVTVIYFMAGYIQDQWDQISGERLDVNAPVLIMAQLGIVIGMVMVQPWGTLIAIRGLGGSLTRGEIWQAFFTGQVAKYLPGSLWSLPSRGFLYNQRGLPVKNSVEVVLWETGLAVVAATLLFSVALPMLWGYQYLPLILLEIGGFSMAFIGGSVALRIPFVRDFFSRFGIFRRLIDVFPHLPSAFVVRALLIYMLQWIIIGASFMGIVYALDDSISATEFVQGIGLFPGVWAVGLLIFITPGGIGIREALLTVALGRIVDDPIPLFAAVIARLCWTGAEVIGITISTVVYNRQLARRSASQEAAKGRQRLTKI